MVTISNQTRRPLRGRRAFSTLAEAVLPGWEVSLVFVTPAKARSLNQSLREKTYTPNVLSYQAGAKSAEIIICPKVSDEEATTYGHSRASHVLYLFIHGLLHIKGMKHGATMERREQELLARVATSARALSNVTTHRNRHRHRDVPGQTGRRRRSH